MKNKLTWTKLYQGPNKGNYTWYGPLKRGKRIVANGVSENDAVTICRAVNKAEAGKEST